MTTFDDMDFGDRKAALVAALASQGIETPLPVQAKAIPRLLSGGNLVVQAPTGTGKTLAYLLPALARIDAEHMQAQTVVLAPTYELAMQIAKTAQELAQAAELPIRALGLIGGANIQRQIEKLKKKPQLIVGSAGRLIELAHKGKLKLQDVNFSTTRTQRTRLTSSSSCAARAATSPSSTHCSRRPRRRKPSNAPTSSTIRKSCASKPRPQPPRPSSTTIA